MLQFVCNLGIPCHQKLHLLLIECRCALNGLLHGKIEWGQEWKRAHGLLAATTSRDTKHPARTLRDTALLHLQRESTAAVRASRPVLEPLR